MKKDAELDVLRKLARQVDRTCTAGSWEAHYIKEWKRIRRQQRMANPSPAKKGTDR